MKRRFHRNPNPDAAWLAAHPGWVTFRSPVFKKDEFRLLRASTEFWSSAALWKKSAGVWSCVGADSPLSWMIGKTHEQAHLELLKLEADYSWAKGTMSGPPCISSFLPDKSGSQTIEPTVRPADGHSSAVKVSQSSETITTGTA